LQEKREGKKRKGGGSLWNARNSKLNGERNEGQDYGFSINLSTPTLISKSGVVGQREGESGEKKRSSGPKIRKLNGEQEKRAERYQSLPLAEVPTEGGSRGGTD